MKISLHWLKSYLRVSLPTSDTAELLTGCGLEVEGMELFQSVKGGLRGLVVGEVKTCTRHPNADKLSLTTVDTGNEVLSIVCGASNVAAGQKVIVATVGTMLYPLQGEPFEIKKSKIRGEISEGMICAEDEIGLGSSHEGILVLPDQVKPGTPAADYFQVEEDTVLEIGLTPNRADAASHIGVARDLRAALLHSGRTGGSGVPSLEIPSVDDFRTGNGSSIAVDVQSTACPRYSGVTIGGVEVKESPGWLKNRLNAIGVTPINNIVDITNFVLHECGQPLHAFDAGAITGRKVVVRMAKAGEKFVTLDHVEREMTASDLLICNAEDPMCIAGVFGGLNSGITPVTKEVFLESACFAPASIRQTSKRHGLKTDASFRFERGTDPDLTVYALKRAALLICEVAGGTVSSDIVDIVSKPVQPAQLILEYSVLDGLVGETIDRKRVRSILEALDFKIEKEEAGQLHLAVPTHKTDVVRPADVVEEILRIHGFNNVGLPAFLRSSLPSTGFDPDLLRDDLAEYLCGNGFYELMTNSLTRSRYRELADFGDAPVNILNALSQDQDMMRQTMLYSGLEAIAYNKNRKHADVKFFEFGKTYAAGKEGFGEKNHLALFIAGKKMEPSWNADSSPADFSFLKSFVHNILLRSGLTLRSLAARPAENHPWIGEGLLFSHHNRSLVSFGSVRASLLKAFDLQAPVWFADINWDALLKSVPATPPQFREIAKFPHVRRDLSMVLGKEVAYDSLEKLAFATEKNLLQEVQLFDVYEGEKIEPGKKSYSLSFILQDEHQTLTEKQIDKTMNRLMEAFEKQAGAVIRKG